MNTQHYQERVSPLSKKGCLPPVRNTTGHLNLSELEEKWDSAIDPVPLNHRKSPAGHAAGITRKENNFSCVNMPGGYRGKKKRAIIRLVNKQSAV